MIEVVQSFEILEETILSVRAYAAINKNAEVRKISSSGAVFYELAKWAIAQNGVVFGVKFGEQWNVVHGHAETMDEAVRFLGSKYVQSNVQDEYGKAKDYLDAGRIVLFSGTPCQISALKSFLKKEYENLFTVDLICHGVPSPSVWKKYLQEISAGRSVLSINFRAKTEGWMKYSLQIDFSDGSRYRKTLNDDLYLQGFLQNIYLRPSCYECRFKGTEREADITLADYWGVHQDIPQMFDGQGTSLILVHSEKGESLWSAVSGSFSVCEVDAKLALSHNVGAVSSATLSAKRDEFYSGGIASFEKLRRLTKRRLDQRAKQKIKAFVKKILGRV